VGANDFPSPAHISKQLKKYDFQMYINIQLLFKRLILYVLCLHRQLRKYFFKADEIAHSSPDMDKYNRYGEEMHKYTASKTA